MDSYLFQQYLYVRECNESDWGSNAALLLLILSRYPLLDGGEDIRIGGVFLTALLLAIFFTIYPELFLLCIIVHYNDIFCETITSSHNALSVEFIFNKKISSYANE